MENKTMTREEQAARESDEADRLVGRFQAGERAAFAALYTGHFDQVFAYMRIALHNSDEIDDAVQQVFVQALEALPRYQRRAGHTFQAWLFTIARNHAIDELRRLGRIEVTEPAELNRRREKIAAEAEAAGGIDALTWLTDENILLFLERLPMPQRQVLALRFTMDLSVAETAAILERTIGDVGILQHRALKFLKKRLISIGREPKKAETDHDPMTTYTKFDPVLRNRRYALK